MSSANQSVPLYLFPFCQLQPIKDLNKHPPFTLRQEV